MKSHIAVHSSISQDGTGQYISAQVLAITRDSCIKEEETFCVEEVKESFREQAEMKSDFEE